MAHPRHDSVRPRFQNRCGYCGVDEVHAGGELTVDHFQPLAAGGGDVLDNLVYACFRCNTYKGDFWPERPNAEARLLHPLRDNLPLHIQEDLETGLLIPRTPTGAFHVEALRLNRPQLVKRRLLLRLQEIVLQRQEMLERENAFLRSRLALLEKLVEGNG